MRSTVTETRLRLGFQPVLALAWVVTLLVSTLPNILFTELTGETPGWVYWAKVGLLAILVGASYVWAPAKPLRSFFAILIAMYLVEDASFRLGKTDLWQTWFGGAEGSFNQVMLSTQLRRVAVALVMIGVLMALRYKPQQFFLIKGDLDAPVEPVKWLGIDDKVNWMQLGKTLSLFISLGTLAFLVLAGRPSLALATQALPLLPGVLLFATANAFSEEVTYRSALLAPLEGRINRRQMLLITAAFFGLGHFYGVPYGVVGVLMAGFLGWLLGKSMLETRGFFWAWFIHFLQDVMIFTFMGIGSIIPGGG